MDILQALILGIVQGLTEFLPVSSSGHLVIVPYVLGFPNAPVIFDAMVHVATLFAVVLFFRKDLFDMARSFVSGSSSKEDVLNRKLGIMIVIATVPAAVIGFLFEDEFAAFFSDPLSAGFFLIVTGVVLIATERIAKDSMEIERLDAKKSVFVGLAQALAILPGISRSGSTIVAGMLLGLTRESATRFSFLISVPIIAGAGAFAMKKAFVDSAWEQVSLQVLLAGTLSAFIVGFVSIGFFLGFVKKHPLNVFAYYCFIVGVAVVSGNLFW
ncbi:MAG: undecaprenyl-diphosphatase UppP [Candidatus Altiarchaeales archaeon IMC4]|nr:MAG: undecaprenyl-diphosphatase UppP [Candidatus Altiarchaeales archaeon IMC4]